jgi:nitrogen-specific signal transduction histidine kinase/ActR/RegA family two-component response regulator
VQYLEGTFTDITERKLLEDQLRQSQKMESLGTLAGGIAHDFNNILQIILVNTQSLRRGNLDPNKLTQVLDINSGAVKRGASLVQQILTFARKTDVSFESLNLNVVIEELVKMLKETFPKTIVFDSDLEKHLPLIVADFNQVHQVLLNLCVNARDAMPEGGSIHIGTKTVAGHTLARQNPEAREDHYICISVTDSGHGMDELTRSRVFEPFFTTKDKGKGTGLGLAVVYGIMKTHRGFIDVRSQPGAGTTFSCYLPISWGRAPSVAPAVESVEEFATGKETILLVEDEAILLDSLSILLEGNGYHVITARDGEEAVDVYRSKHGEIALVVTDIGLPKLSGWDAFLQMKRINPNVKAIVSSGYLDPKIKEERSSQGVSDYILKPYQPVEILKRVRGALDGKTK